MATPVPARVERHRAPARSGAAAAVRARLARIPRPLAALLVAAILLQLSWTVLTMHLMGPDEHNHAAYVQQLAETGDGPDFGPTQGGTWSSESVELQKWEDLAALIGVLNARPGWTSAEQDAWRSVQGQVARDDGSGPNPVAQNPPLYYAYQSVPYLVGSGGTLPTRLLLMRLANLPLLIVVIVSAWIAIGEAFGRRRFLQTVGTGVVALLPMLGFMSGVINPDIALCAAFSAFTALALVGLRVGPRPAVVAGLAAIGGIAVLTHGRGLAILPALAFVLLAIAWRGRRALTVRRTALLGLLAIAIVAVAGFIALRYSGAHGGGAGLTSEVGSSGSHGNLTGFLSYLWQFYFSPLNSLAPPPGPPYGFRQVYIETFLAGTFGSLEILYPMWVYSLVQVLAPLGLIVLIAAIARRWEDVRAHALPIAVVAVLVISVLLTVHLASYSDLAQGSPDPLMTGRYLLPLVVPLALAAAFVVQSLPRRLGVAVGTLVVSGYGVMSLAALALTLARFYV